MITIVKYKSTGCELLREIREKIPEKMKKKFLENIYKQIEECDIDIDELTPKTICDLFDSPTYINSESRGLMEDYSIFIPIRLIRNWQLKFFKINNIRCTFFIFHSSFFPTFDLKNMLLSALHSIC